MCPNNVLKIQATSLHRLRDTHNSFWEGTLIVNMTLICLQENPTGRV